MHGAYGSLNLANKPVAGKNNQTPNLQRTHTLLYVPRVRSSIANDTCGGIYLIDTGGIQYSVLGAYYHNPMMHIRRTLNRLSCRSGLHIYIDLLNNKPLPAHCCPSASPCYLDEFIKSSIPLCSPTPHASTCATFTSLIAWPPVSRISQT